MHTLLTHPLPDLAAWMRALQDAELPVLADTAAALHELRDNEDAADANMLGELIAADPLMTLKVMSHVARHRPERRVTDPETVTAAIVLMGITPFFRAFETLTTAEDWLADDPDALEGLRSVIARGHRAARFALAFAVHRIDPETAVIHQAALLHDFAEMLLWCHAPALAKAIRSAQAATPGLRSVTAQQAALNIDLGELQQALMQHWRLPDLLTRLADDRHAENVSVKTVALAVRLARHSAVSWDNPALADDVAELSKLLVLSSDATLHLLQDVER
jgi:HD-like signal output (HDOD) protein